MGHAPLGGSCEKKNVPTPLEVPSLAGRSAGMAGWGGSAATGLWKAKQRGTCTDGWYSHPALPSLRCASAGTGRGWVRKLGLQRSDPERGLGLAAWRQPEGAGVWCNYN